MIISSKTSTGTGTIDLTEFVDISIPLTFNGAQPNAYGVEKALAEACENGVLVGDTRRGGSCNFERITMIPHCNGTHTECIGHITNDRISVRECLRDAFISAVLVSVEPTQAGKSSESYSMPFSEDDLLLTRQGLIKAEPPALAGGEALILRTLPNNDGKLTQQYNYENVPPYFTNDAMDHIVQRGFKHLLVDLPSIDRLYDEGRLSNHRIFWNVEEGKFETNAKSRTTSTITEMIYVPNEVKDGQYLLNLQIAPFESDASPSRPLLFKMHNS